MIKAMQSELSARDEWVKEHIAGDVPPFSFMYGKRPSASFLQTWNRSFTQSVDADTGAGTGSCGADTCAGADIGAGAGTGGCGATRYTASWADPETGLEVTCKAVSYPGYPAIEWTVYFKNNGTEDTPILEDIQGMDIVIKRNAEDDCVLRTIRGDTNSPMAYEPLAYDMAEYRTLKFSPLNGRPCHGAFPYFNLQLADKGIIIAVGWPGQWAASFQSEFWHAYEGPTVLLARAGQELTCLSLRPGEEIRSPLMLLMFYEGGCTRSQNLWRRFFNAHNVQKPGGKLLEPVLYGGPIEDPLFPNEESVYKAMRERAEHGMHSDFFGVDAGWFPCTRQTWFGYSGTWEPDKSRFPNGLKPISDAARAGGMKFSLWFDPERVTNGTWIHKNHPEWLLSTENADPFLKGCHLLNLGCPEALDWLISHMDRCITEHGMDIYRQDFNFLPLVCWRGADAPGRQGMAENLHVQGYLKLLDELLRRHPDLIYDSCAGGGTRQDLETNRRTTLMVTRSDYEHARFFKDKNNIGAYQNLTYGLANWFTHFAAGGLDTDHYANLSHFSVHMYSGYTTDPAGWEALHGAQREFWEGASCCYGDYYPLTDYSREVDVWLAYQFNLPEAGEGILLAFRRDESPVPEMVFKLNDLDADAVYSAVDVRAMRTTAVMSGAELMDVGLRVELPAPRSAVLIKYKKN